MLVFLIGRVEAMIATLDLSKGTKDPITHVRSELDRTSDGGVFQLTVNNRRYLISVEECND